MPLCFLRAKPIGVMQMIDQGEQVGASLASPFCDRRPFTNRQGCSPFHKADGCLVSRHIYLVHSGLLCHCTANSARVTRRTTKSLPCTMTTPSSAATKTSPSCQSTGSWRSGGKPPDLCSPHQKCSELGAVSSMRTNCKQ